MIKKIFILLVLIIIFLGGSVIYGRLKYREQLRQLALQKQNEKAPQTSITLLEGWDNQDIANYLEKNGITKAADFLSAQKNFDVSDYPLLATKPQSSDLEGFIFPDTYFIPKQPSSGININSFILTKTLDNFTNKISPQMLMQAKADNMSLFQTLTLASIIEKETGKNSVTAGQKTALDEQRKNVASVFYNRLKAGMALQSDATVNFITGKNTPALTIQDTQIDSPYNTYAHPGLPPDQSATHPCPR